MKLFLLSATLMIGQATLAQTIRPSDSLVSPANVALKGPLGQALELSEHGRLRELPVWNNGTLITMFTPEARSKNTTTDWYGEHAGKWMYATTLAVLRSHGARL